MNTSGVNGKVHALSISERKGIPKSNVGHVRLIADWGIDGDAHSGRWHRQVSLLAMESIEKMQSKGAKVNPGAFAENITTAHFDLQNLSPGDRLQVGEAILEITQIGKECHQRCAIYEQVGDCVMPREGIFAKVVQGGSISVGDSISKERKCA